MQIRRQLKEVLKHWQEWPVSHAPSLIDSFSIGENHDTFLISAGDEKLVVKLFHAPQPGAVRVQQWAASKNLAPLIVYHDTVYSYAVMQYLPDNDPNDLIAIAAGLRSLHTLTAPEITAEVGDFDLLVFCEQYIQQAGVEAEQLHQQVLPALQAFIIDQTPWCLCHNDLVQANCFVSAGQASFIDWEYAQRHNPWFDLAAIIYYFRLDPNQARDFLESYQIGWGNKVEQPIFIDSQCALLWGDILWHLARGDDTEWEVQKPKIGDLKSLLSARNPQ